MGLLRSLLGGAALMLAAAGTAWAQSPVKIGLILPMTGPFQSTGRQIDAAVKLFIQQHGDTVGGHKVEILLRDDAGVADTTRRLAQEMVVRDHVNILAGFGLTPLAMAAAPIATQAKIPQVVMAGATSSITAASNYIVRSAQVTPTFSYVAAEWAFKNGVKSVVTVVSDFAPGVDVETWFGKRFKELGGTVTANLRVPLANPDFSPFLQRVADAKPDALFAFVPSGVGAIFVKQFLERGLDKSGIRLLATGDVTDDDILNGMGDAVLGVITAGPYSASHDSALNRKFVAEYVRANPGSRPNFMAVFGYDGMQLIYSAIEKTGGNLDGAALVEAMKGMAFESPRGPISIDPATRDIIENIYVRRVEKIGGELFNTEFETFPNVKDPAKGG